MWKDVSKRKCTISAITQSVQPLSVKNEAELYRNKM